MFSKRILEHGRFASMVKYKRLEKRATLGYEGKSPSMILVASIACLCGKVLGYDYCSL